MMPTGYTAAVADGKITSLEAFAMQLARGMGALITMRDEPHDAPIPERFEPSSYHADKLVEMRAERDRLRAMTSEDAQQSADAEMGRYEQAKADGERKHTERRNRYDAMIAKVVQWQGAPEGVKEFGLEQLHRGRDFDCGGPFKLYRERPETDGAKWRDAQLAEVHRQIEYHATEDAKERERAEGRTSWLRQLRASLFKTQEMEKA